MASLIPPVGRPTFIAPAAGPAFTLAELQGFVGGYIEVVASPFTLADGEPIYLVINEDGKRLNLPINRFATVLLHQAGGAPDDCIVGVALLATLTELGD